MKYNKFIKVFSKKIVIPLTKLIRDKKHALVIPQQLV